MPNEGWKSITCSQCGAGCFDDAEIKYSTVQNWYPGDKNGVGGIYNFVTKRGACRGKILRRGTSRDRVSNNLEIS